MLCGDAQHAGADASASCLSAGAATGVAVGVVRKPALHGLAWVHALVRQVLHVLFFRAVSLLKLLRSQV